MNKKEHVFKISDIHFEIDMELLGCNAKILWNVIYYNILDIISTKADLTGIIVCKNFHMIHSELLETFYSYMQTLLYRNVHIVFIRLIISSDVFHIFSSGLNYTSVNELRVTSVGFRV